MTGTSAVIPAAGRGERFGKGRTDRILSSRRTDRILSAVEGSVSANKVFALAAGRPTLAWTLRAFEDCPAIDEIVVVVREPEIDEARRLADKYGISKLVAVVAGGSHRQDSVRKGIEAASPSSDIIAIHDGARPLVRQETIEAAVAAAREHGAAVAAVPVIDTIKSANAEALVTSTLDRRTLWAIQTPQVFDRSLLMRAIRQAEADGFYATDDAALVERLGQPVKLVMGSYDNIKVTTPLDLEFVEARLGETIVRETRTGFGYDIHRFAEPQVSRPSTSSGCETRKLFLGGVEFPGEIGLEGHSDADVILHAIADALLGAAAMGDIGRHFPNTDPAYRGISSLTLLERTASIIAEAGWETVNVDATLVAERPKIADRVPEMQTKIASALGIEPGRVSVKATTAERLGDIGAGKGAECYAVATVRASSITRFPQAAQCGTMLVAKRFVGGKHSE